MINYINNKILVKGITLAFLQIVLFFFTTVLSAQNKADSPFTLYGSIIDAKKNPVMDAHVYVSESTANTMTDELGQFSIDLPGKNLMLRIEARGFISADVKIVNEDRITVMLQYAKEGQGDEDILDLPWKRTDIRSNTASVSRTSYSLLRKSPVMNLSSAVSGRLPGLTVIQESGSPGYDAALWRVRGLRTLENINSSENNMTKGGDGSPLIVVDGFERSFTGLDASEIESITLLKDAASTAIYGIRGANGVLFVKTRRGEDNKRTIDIEVSSGIVMPTRLPVFYNSHDYAVMFNEARQNDGLDPIYTDEDLQKYRDNSDPIGYPNVDYYKEFIKQAAMQTRAALTLSGGNRIVKYFVSFGMNSQDGLYKRTEENPAFSTKSNFSKYNTRANLDIQLAKRWQVSLNLSGRIEFHRRPYAEASSIFGVLSGYPSNAIPISFMGEDPVLKKEIFMLGGSEIYTNNPLGQLSFRGTMDGTRRYYALGTIIKHDMSYLTEGLNFNIEFNADGYNLYNDFKRKQFLVWKRTVEKDGTLSYRSFNEESSIERLYSATTSKYWGLNLNLSYSRKFGDHSIDGLLLLRRYNETYQSANQPDYKVEDLVFRAGYSYKNRYFTEFTANYSGSDNFWGTTKPRILYPAISAGWIISDEPFFGKSETVSFLKLRASWGITGNNQYSYKGANNEVYRFPYRDRWWTSTRSLIFGIPMSYVKYVVREGIMPNPDFTSEKSAMTNIGLDATFFSHRLSLTLDYFYDSRYDIFSKGVGTMPAALGIKAANLPLENRGKASSQGGELVLGWRDKIGDFRYSINGYADYSVSKIENMDEPYKEEAYRIETGGKIGQYFGLKAIGLFKNQKDIDESPIQKFGPYQPGDIKYEDLNKDGLVDINDYTAIGSTSMPAINYGLDISLSYRDIDFSMLFQGAADRSLYMRNAAVRAFYENGNISTFAKNRYTDEASWSNADYPRLTTLQNDNNWRISTYWLKNTSFLKLRNVELGYNLPQKYAKKMGMYGFRIYLNAYNLFSFDNLKYFDVEDPDAGVSSYPQIRIFNIGLNLKF